METLQLTPEHAQITLEMKKRRSQIQKAGEAVIKSQLSLNQPGVLACATLPSKIQWQL